MRASRDGVTRDLEMASLETIRDLAPLLSFVTRHLCICCSVHGEAVLGYFAATLLETASDTSEVAVLEYASDPEDSKEVGGEKVALLQDMMHRFAAVTFSNEP